MPQDATKRPALGEAAFGEGVGGEGALKVVGVSGEVAEALRPRAWKIAGRSLVFRTANIESREEAMAIERPREAGLVRFGLASPRPAGSR